MAASGKKNREIQGKGQIRNVVRESIKDGEITAIKLNADVAGAGLRLNPTTNAIELETIVPVSTADELISAIASGEMYIFLTDGLYSLNGIVASGTLQLTGQSRNGVIIELPPSGIISVSHPSGEIRSGQAELNIGNPGLVTISGGNVSGLAQFAYTGAHLVLDNIPYEVNRVVSGEVSGSAVVELIEPWTGTSGFSGKDFNLMYLVDDFSLRNLTVRSASHSGIVNIKRARHVWLENIRLQGANILSRETSGLNTKYVYSSLFNAVEILHTNDGIFTQYGMVLDETHYSNFYNCCVFNTDSDGVRIVDSSFISFYESKMTNINNGPFDIINSANIEVNGSHFASVFGGSNIQGCDKVYFNNNYFDTDADAIVLNVTDTQRLFLQSNFFNGTTGDTTININSGSHAVINSNYIRTAGTGIIVQSGSIAITTDNQLLDVTNGINYDSTVTQSVLNNNTIDAITSAVVVAGTGNYLSNNAVLSGSISVASGNVFTTLTTIEPQATSDIGTSANPFRDVYLTGNIYGVEAVYMNSGTINNVVAIYMDSGASGTIYGLEGLYLNDRLLTADSGVIYIDGVPVQGGGGGFSSGVVEPYIHTQSVASTTWTVNHNRNSFNFIVSVFNSSGELFWPQDIVIVDSGTVSITHGFARTGKAVFSFIDGAIPATAITPLKYVHTQAVAAATWNVAHNLGTDSVIVQAYNNSGELFFPNTTTVVDSNNVTIVNSIPTAGYAVILTAI